MLKPTETSKKVKILRKNFANNSSISKKLQKFQVFGKNLQKSYSLGYFLLYPIYLENYTYVQN